MPKKSNILQAQNRNFDESSSFIELEKFQLEYILSSRKMIFSSLSLSLETSLLNFGGTIPSISCFIEFEFLKNTIHRTRISSSFKYE